MLFILVSFQFEMLYQIDRDFFYNKFIINDVEKRLLTLIFYFI
jgi:hypothetical protein